jgi:hypothetical protein
MITCTDIGLLITWLRGLAVAPALRFASVLNMVEIMWMVQGGALRCGGSISQPPHYVSIYNNAVHPPGRLFLYIVRTYSEHFETSLSVHFVDTPY